MQHVSLYSTILLFIIFNLNVFQDLTVKKNLFKKFSLEELEYANL